MSAVNGPRAVAFPRRRQAGLVGNYTGLQLSTALLGAVLLVVAVFAFGGDIFAAVQVAGIPAVALIGLGAWTNEHGYPMVSTLIDGIRFFMRKQQGQTSFRRPLRSAPVDAGRLSLPGGLASVQMFEQAEGEKAIIENRAHGTVSAVLEVTTPGYGLLDAPQQRERVDSWALFQGSLIRHAGLARIQVLASSRVSSPTAISDYYHGRRSTIVSSWGHEQYEIMLANGVANSPHHAQHIVVVLDRIKLGRTIKEQGGGRAGVAQVMEREVESLTAGLAETGVSVRSWLSARETASVLRKAYDPSSSDLIDNRAGERAGVAPSSAGPIAGDEAWDHIRTDTAFHMTFEVTEWPRIPTLPDFLKSITGLPFQHTLSLYFTPVALKRSLSRIKSERGRIDSNREIRRRRGNLREDSAFEREERAVVDRREVELVQGFGDLEFLGLVTVTGATLEEVKANASTFRTAVESRGLEVRPMNGQQLAAFNCAALPLGLAPSATKELFVKRAG